MYQIAVSLVCLANTDIFIVLFKDESALEKTDCKKISVEHVKEMGGKHTPSSYSFATAAKDLHRSHETSSDKKDTE